MLILTYFSEIWNQRAALGAIGQLWMLPNIIALAVLPSNASAWAKYAVTTVLLSMPSSK